MTDKGYMRYPPAAYESEIVALLNLIEGSIDDLVNTCEVVRVVSVDSDKNELTVIPVVKNVYTNNDSIDETNIYGVKYIKWQYGSNAIEAIPKKDDIGIVVVSKRDISKIDSGIVNSKRKFNMADGIYLGGLCGFNQAPTQYIKFTDDGIEITSPKDIKINAKNAEITTETAKINASEKVDIISAEVNLGGSGGAQVARVGDSVMVNGSLGSIISGSSVVKST